MMLLRPSARSLHRNGVCHAERADDEPSCAVPEFARHTDIEVLDRGCESALHHAAPARGDILHRPGARAAEGCDGHGAHGRNGRGRRSDAGCGQRGARKDSRRARRKQRLLHGMDLAREERQMAEDVRDAVLEGCYALHRKRDGRGRC